MIKFCVALWYRVAAPGGGRLQTGCSLSRQPFRPVGPVEAAVSRYTIPLSSEAARLESGPPVREAARLESGPPLSAHPSSTSLSLRGGAARLESGPPVSLS